MPLAQRMVSSKTCAEMKAYFLKLLITRAVFAGQCQPSGCIKARVPVWLKLFICCLNETLDKGYQLRDGKCVDIDECLGNPCDANADCFNTNGRFVCNCKRGFVGTGFQCRPYRVSLLNQPFYDVNLDVANWTCQKTRLSWSESKRRCAEGWQRSWKRFHNV